MALFGGGTHTITIITEAVDKASGRLRKVSESVRQINSQMGTQIETTRKLNERTGQFTTSTRRATSGMHQFAFEFLGVMFLGMAIQRMFAGLIKTSLEWVGVQEVMSSALGVLFLPVALQMLEWAILFFQWVSELSPATQKFLGKTKDIVIDGDEITLQPLKVKEMAEFSIKDPTPEQENALVKAMINLSIPGTSNEEIDNLPLSIALQLIEEISKFNGFTDERVTKIAEALRKRKSGK